MHSHGKEHASKEKQQAAGWQIDFKKPIAYSMNNQEMPNIPWYIFESSEQKASIYRTEGENNISAISFLSSSRCSQRNWAVSWLVCSHSYPDLWQALER